MAAQNESVINLNRIWYAKSHDGKENVTLGIFGRKAAFTVFSNSGESKKPVMKLDLPMARSLFLIDTLTKVMKSQDPIRLPVVTTTYNFNTKKRVPGTSMVFFKDDKRRLGFDLVADGVSVKFIFDENRDTSDGKEALTEDVRSLYGARVFLDVVLRQQLPMAYMLMFMNPAPQFTSSGGSSRRSPDSGRSSVYDSPDENSAVWDS